MMICPSADIFLSVFLVAIKTHISEGVSPNIGAPDSNNLNMDFSPDDSMAGAADTRGDNSNATPLIIPAPKITTSTAEPTSQTTTPTTTTTFKHVPTTIQYIPKIATTKAGAPKSIIYLEDTPKSIAELMKKVAEASTARKTIITKSSTTTTKIPKSILAQIVPDSTSGQNQQNWLNHYPSMPQYRIGTGSQANIIGTGSQSNFVGNGNQANNLVYGQEGGNSPQPRGSNSPVQGGRLNVPWWWLLMDV